MIKIENIDVCGWEAAIRGARNPMNSWDKSDSCWDWTREYPPISPDDDGWEYILGSNDLRLLMNLANAGPDHGKYLRMITVTVDLTAPLYWWKEFDTYKVGTVANSCSTMHKIHAKEFTMDDFSHDHLMDDGHIVDGGNCFLSPMDCLREQVVTLNMCRNKFFEAKTKPMKEEAKRSESMKQWWWQMIQLLPSSYNQRRTVQLNYAVLKAMYHARKNHKLDEWHVLRDEIKALPYFEKICLED